MTQVEKAELFVIKGYSGLRFSSVPISSQFELDTRTVNISLGRADGYSPRYGMEPLQGHATHLQAGSYANGLVRAEGISADVGATGAFDRVGVYGCYRHEMRDSTNPAKPTPVYVWLTDRKNGVLQRLLSWSESSVYATGKVSSFAAGINHNVWNGGSFYDGRTLSNVTQISPESTGENNQALFLNSAMMNVSGKTYPARWLVMGVDTGDSTSAPKAIATTVGYPDSWYSAKINETRNFIVQALGNFTLRNKHSFDSLSVTNYGSSPVVSVTDAHTARVSLPSGGTVTARDTTIAGGTNPVTTTQYLINDSQNTVSSDYTLFVCAKENPYACIFKNSKRAQVLSGLEVQNSLRHSQVVHLSSPIAFTPAYATTLPGSATKYTEDTIETKTVFYSWPAFTSTGALAYDAAAENTAGTAIVTLGAQNSGVLRKDAVYEITYSVFDKSLGVETNVGVPAKIRTGSTNDYVRLSIHRQTFAESGGTGPNFKALFPSIRRVVYTPNLTQTNHLQFRFYYREAGAFEWLAAGQFDAAQYFYDTLTSKFWICEGDDASILGGQPGGFVDHSPLPSEQWLDVKPFQRTLVWLSPTSLVFSSLDNPLEYPTRNSVSCLNGSFVGMIQHAYPGQSSQDSRLVVFGTQETYTFRFRGAGFGTKVFVQESSEGGSVREIPLSDWTLSSWTSATSFSGRSAVVADGILYWWGSEGIYRDEGAALPKNLTEATDLQLYVSRLYQKHRTKDIHAIYNARTFEIIWFYPPAPDPVTGIVMAATKALVYNTRFGEFTQFEFPTNLRVDWSQNLSVSECDTRNTGERILLGVNVPFYGDSRMQRCVFFDELCPAGDTDVQTPQMVTNVSDLGATYRLTLAPSVSENFGSVGDRLSIKHAAKFSLQSNIGEGSYVISATNPAGRTIDVTKIVGLTLPTGAIASTNSYPVYLDSVSTVNAVMRSRFWAPKGMASWFDWQYAHSVFRVSLLSNDTPTLGYTFYSLLRSGGVSNVVTLSDNSQGLCQIHHAIKFTDSRAQGQALAFELTGTQNGEEWTLQYLHFEARPDTRGNLRQFEG